MLLEVLYCISIGFSAYNEYRYIQVLKQLSTQSKQISQLTETINNNFNNDVENCEYI